MQMKSICGSLINQVEDFKYLGFYIRTTKRYVNISFAKAWSVLNSIKHNLELKFNYSSKKKFVQSCS